MMDVPATVTSDQPTLPLPKGGNNGEALPSDEVKSRPAPVFAPTREAPSPGDCAPDMTKGAPSASSLANDNMLPGLSTAVSADDSPEETTFAPRVSNSPVVAGDVHQQSASSNTATRSESGAPHHPNANNETSSILSSLASEDSVMDKSYPTGGSVASWGGQISPPKAHHGTMHHTTVAEAETAVAPKYTMPEDHLSLSMMGRNMMNNIYGVPTSSAPFIVNNAENNLSMLEGTMMRHIHGISTTTTTTDAPSSETNAEKKTEPAVSQTKKHEAEEVASEEGTEPPKKKKKKKKAKDPNAPVRPKTGYMFYSCNGARTAVKEAYPDLTFGEVTKVVAANWNAMSEEKKEVWNRMAADDRERYQREMDDYKGSELEAQWLASLEEDTAEEAKWVAELKAAEEAKWLAELRVAQEKAKVAEAKAREEAAVKELAEAKAREEAVVKKKMEWLTSLETKQETDTDEVQEEAVEEEESGELLLNISPGKLGLKIKMDEVLGGVVIVKVLDVCTFKDLVGTGWRIITIDDVPVKSVTDFAFKEGEIEKNRLMKFVKP